jgi:hemoglobin/transferrin/lactoferrin receptor protein
MEDGTYARVTEFVKEKPMDHIPPFFGRAAVRYFKKNWDVEFYSIYNGWKRLDEYNADGEDNAQYATAEGSPGWYTLNLKAQWQFERIRLQAGVENILDKHYRQFASGFSAAGRNLVLALRVSL